MSRAITKLFFYTRSYNAFAALLIFLCYYYPIGLWRNAEPTNAVHERGALFFLFVQEFLLFVRSEVVVKLNIPLKCLLRRPPPSLQ